MWPITSIWVIATTFRGIQKRRILTLVLAHEIVRVKSLLGVACILEVVICDEIVLSTLV